MPGFKEDPFPMSLSEFDERGEQRRAISASKQTERQRTKQLTELSLGAVAFTLLGIGVLSAGQRVYGNHDDKGTLVNRIDQTPVYENSFVDRNGKVQMLTNTGDYAAYKAATK